MIVVAEVIGSLLSAAIRAGGIQGRVPQAIPGNDRKEGGTGGTSGSPRTSPGGKTGSGHHGRFAQEPGDGPEAPGKRESRDTRKGCKEPPVPTLTVPAITITDRVSPFIRLCCSRVEHLLGLVY
jgi:hypothetical protein